MAKRQSDKTDTLTTFKVEPKTEGQRIYYEALFDPKIRYLAATGYPGTGKSFLSVYRALEGLRKEEFNKLYISRSVTPIKGEALGFLKGTVEEKFEEWMIPLLEHAEKMTQDIDKLLDSGRIEYLPLAFVRGRSLERAVVLCTESQNLGFDTIKCLLTRMDFRSKLILEGDVKQNDKVVNGITDFQKVCEALEGMEHFKHIKLGREDIIRSKDIAEILDRLEKLE